jgi:hypothetical protein
MSDLEAVYVRSPETSHNGKNISRGKTMCVGPDKLTISKLDNMDLREIMRICPARVSGTRLVSWIRLRGRTCPA